MAFRFIIYTKDMLSRSRQNCIKPNTSEFPLSNSHPSPPNVYKRYELVHHARHVSVGQRVKLNCLHGSLGGGKGAAAIAVVAGLGSGLGSSTAGHILGHIHPQTDASRRKRSCCFSQEKWSDRARRNQTQNALENLKTATRERFGVTRRDAS